MADMGRMGGSLYLAIRKEKQKGSLHLFSNYLYSFIISVILGDVRARLPAERPS